MTISAVGNLDWTFGTTSASAQRKSSTPASAIDFSALPADLVKILQEGDGELPSSDDVARMADVEKYINLPAGRGNTIAAWHELTAGDKQIIKQTTGWDMFTDPFGRTASEDALAFAGRLNLDRYTESRYGYASGLNGGEISRAYISKLIEENFSKQPDQAVVPLSILYKVQSFLGGDRKVA